MKTFVILFLVMVSVNAGMLNIEEHVKRFFRAEHRKYLPETTMTGLQEDENALENVVQRDESTKCMSVCEEKCDAELKIPGYLLVNMTLKCLISESVDMQIMFV